LGYIVNDPLIDAEDEASTPLTPEERDALVPSHVTLRRELNEIEQQGVADADRWAFSRKHDVLGDPRRPGSAQLTDAIDKARNAAMGVIGDRRD
jgi:hypothetical protein